MLDSSGDRPVLKSSIITLVIFRSCFLYCLDGLALSLFPALNFQIPLETWLKFELGAAWGDVPVEVRQTFLYGRLLGNVSIAQHFISSTPESHPPLLDRVVAAFVSSFAVLGLKQVCLVTKIDMMYPKNRIKAQLQLSRFISAT